MQSRQHRVAVTTLFDNTALQRRVLSSQHDGRVAKLTWLLFALGAGGLTLALFGLASGRAGFGSLAAMAACGTLVFAFGRARQERRSPHFVIGDGVDVDLPVRAADQAAATFALLEARAEGYALRFTPSMSGWISDASGFASLAQLIAVGRALAEDTTRKVYGVALPPGSRAQVDLGAHGVAIEGIDDADPLAGGLFAQFSWSSQLFTGLSFFAHAIFLALILAVPADGKTMSLDLFAKNNRFVSYLVKPKVENEVDVLGQLQKTQGLRAGQRHPGPEGRAGDKKAPKRKRRIAFKGPKDNPNPGVAKADIERQARSMGVLGAISSSRTITSIFSRDEGALGRDAEDALGNIVADADPGPAYGIGGLGVSGPGRGGGGIEPGNGVGLVTIGDIGPGTRPNGTWRGRLIRDPNHKTRVPPISHGRIITRGALDKAIVRRYIRQHLAEFRYCYQRSLQQNAKLQGRVVIKFMIAGSGQVAVSQVERSTMGHAPTEQCLAKAMRRITFPAPQGGGTVLVSYPFVFRPAGT